MLDMDPVELRLKNVLREGSLMTVQTPVPKGVSMVEVVERCAAEAQWYEANGQPPASAVAPISANTSPRT